MLAKELIKKRLQFPLTLGRVIKTIEIGEQYLVKLLSTRMLKDKPELTKKVAERLTRGYADHGFCINIEEAKEIGLKAKELKDKELDIVWEIYRLYDKKRKLEKKMREDEIIEMLRSLPEEIMKNLPPELKKLKKKKRR